MNGNQKTFTSALRPIVAALSLCGLTYGVPVVAQTGLALQPELALRQRVIIRLDSDHVVGGEDVTGTIMFADSPDGMPDSVMLFSTDPEVDGPILVERPVYANAVRFHISTAPVDQASVELLGVSCYASSRGSGVGRADEVYPEMVCEAQIIVSPQQRILPDGGGPNRATGLYSETTVSPSMRVRSSVGVGSPRLSSQGIEPDGGGFMDRSSPKMVREARVAVPARQRIKPDGGGMMDRSAPEKVSVARITMSPRQRITPDGGLFPRSKAVTAMPVRSNRKRILPDGGGHGPDP